MHTSLTTSDEARLLHIQTHSQKHQSCKIQTIPVTQSRSLSGQILQTMTESLTQVESNCNEKPRVVS